MEFATIPSGIAARERCIVRGQRLVQVKFVALPAQGEGVAAGGETRRRPGVEIPVPRWFVRLTRVIGRLVAARP